MLKIYKLQHHLFLLTRLKGLSQLKSSVQVKKSMVRRVRLYADSSGEAAELNQWLANAECAAGLII